MGTPTQELRKQIDIPDGWRSGYLNRDFIADPGAFVRGFQILATHVVPQNYVSEVGRIEAGVFRGNPPGPFGPATISQVDQLHWWAPDSDQNPPYVGPPPRPTLDWFLHLVELKEPPNDGNQPPEPGLIGAVPINAALDLPFGQVVHVWPTLRFGLVTWAARKVFVGPTTFALISSWRQGPPGVLPYSLAQSWGLMEGRDLRYDSEDARRLLLAGLT